jgi:hypothetical protein
MRDCSPLRILQLLQSAFDFESNASDGSGIDYENLDVERFS